MVCTVCRHPKLEEIDVSLLEKASCRDIARRFKLKPASVQRHKKHLNETLAKSFEVQEVARADSLVEQLKSLQTDAHRIQSKAEKSRDYRGALAGVRELSRLLQVSMKISEQLATADKSGQGDLSETRQKMYLHAARVMKAHFGLGDEVIMVLTEAQASALAEELRHIFGLKVKGEEALGMANKGLALIAEPEKDD